MRRAALSAAILALAASGIAGAAAGPTWTLGPSGLVLGELPPVLARPEVRPHLDSGLTTTFLLAVEVAPAAGKAGRGAARVDVRWEPWDELYLVAAVGADGRQQRANLRTFDDLASWWRALALPVTGPLAATPRSVEVSLQVLPFSHSEQQDAQRWFSGALGPETAGEPPGSPRRGGSATSDVVDLLMATSIQRRALVRYEWRAGHREAPAP